MGTLDLESSTFCLQEHHTHKENRTIFLLQATLRAPRVFHHTDEGVMHSQQTYHQPYCIPSQTQQPLQCVLGTKPNKQYHSQIPHLIGARKSLPKQILACRNPQSCVSTGRLSCTQVACQQSGIHLALVNLNKLWSAVFVNYVCFL